MLKELIVLSLISYYCGVVAYHHDRFVRALKQKQSSVYVSKEIPLSEYSTQMFNIPSQGLPKCFHCKNIGIVGAGVAGLTAGIELALAGHQVTIYEGSFRVGGRILTYRKPNTNYVTELGAMRLPLDVHKLLKEYIRRYQLPYKEFIASNDNTRLLINNILRTTAEVDKNPAVFGFNVTDSERGKSVDELWNIVTKPLIEMINVEGQYEAFVERYGSYSIDRYLTEMNMSRAAIDYIGLMFNIETNFFTSLAEAVADMQIISDDTKFYHIEGGNDRLTNAMKNQCLSIPGGLCSIIYNRQIVSVTTSGGQTNDISMEYVTANSTLRTPTPRYDTVIVATTATAARYIEFKNGDHFVAKYRALRQVHYDCASKVSLFFKKAWWLDESIRGGRTITDLPIRFSYFHNFNGSYDRGAAIIGSYTWSQDAIAMQSLSDDSLMNLALSNLNTIYPTHNLKALFDGGVVQHWCNDAWSRGAFVLFTPYQEQYLKELLRQPVGSIHFIGEHTSSAHAWIEGSILSALEVSLKIQEEYFDVVIVGGGPIGLATAINLAKKNSSLSIVIIEQGELGNSAGSSGSSDTRQFRQMYNEPYLAELARIAKDLWRELEADANLTAGTLMNTDGGYLFFGAASASETTEGDLVNIGRTCRQLNLGCEFLNSSDLIRRFPFFAHTEKSSGIFHADSGYINVTALIQTLKTLAKKRGIVIRTNESFTELDPHTPTDQASIRLITNRGSMNARRVLFAPGPYARNVSKSLGFTLKMTLWELPTIYFRLRNYNQTIPTWSVFGEDDQSLYYGFSSESSDRPGYVKISPNYIRDMSKPLLFPKDRTNVIDPWVLQRTRAWVAANVPFVDHDAYYFGEFTCLASFLPDNGFILDYLPRQVRYADKLLMYAAGWGMKYVPVWADILAELILNRVSPKYTEYLKYLSFNASDRFTLDKQ